MIHHDSRNYKTASGEAARVGREKMEKIIEQGRASAESVMQGIFERVITDRVVKAPLVKVRRVEKDWQGFIPDGDNSKDVKFHDHAFDQLSQNVGIPKTFINNVAGLTGNEPHDKDWGNRLIAHNINEILERRKDQRNLVRSEGDVVKGWLSDKFRRLDSRPLLEAFTMAAKQMSLVPMHAIASDTKARVRAVLPEVFEPIPNEPMIFGLEWGNSDYGDGGHVVNLWVMRVYCSNLAIADHTLKQIHLGKRLDDNIEYSQRTYQLDTQTNASALRDAVKHAIGEDRINRLMDSISNASAAEIEGKDVAAILKKHFEKADVEKVTQLFESNDTYNMPAGNNLWRLSNAISWLAESKGITPDRKLELQEVAGKIIPHKQYKAIEA